MTTELVISFEVDGLHFWPDAPEQYKEFGQPHRHLFRFRCWLPTTAINPSDRIIELFELRQNTLKLIHDTFGDEPCNFKDYSCEGVAKWLKPFFSKVYVGEDDYFGAEVS